MIDIGQNDLYYGFNTQIFKKFKPLLLMLVLVYVQQLYQEGARFFRIHNTGPIGRLLYSVIHDRSTHVPVSLDPSGCVKPKNEVTRVQ